MKIGVDIDEVLAEHLDAVIEFYKNEKGIFIPKEDFHTYYWPDIWGISLDEAITIDHEFKKTGAFDNLSVVDGSIDAIKKLCLDHELNVITARPFIFKEKTFNWLNLNFGDVFNDIFHSSDFHVGNGENKRKSDICRELGIGLLLEDSAENSLDCAERDIVVLLLDKPWNQGFEHEKIYRCFNWNDILDKIEELENE